jgi:hypothetical protein
MKSTSCKSALFTYSCLALSMILLRPAFASNACQSGQAQITSPADHYTLPATFDVVAQASTGGGCDITAMRLYVDNHTVITFPEGGSPSAGFSYNYTAAEGYHSLVAVAWNNEGYAFASPPISIFAAPYDQTVYIRTPKPNQTVGSTVEIGARVRWDNAFVSHMRAYVDNQDVYDLVNPQYNAMYFQKVFSSGQHYLVIIAWDNAGNYLKAEEFFIVK